MTGQPPPDAPLTWRLERHDTLGSTSDLCLERAAAGAPAGLAIQARRQTRARGSRGRAWSEAAGTLALSVLLRPADSKPPPWPMIAALALHDALALGPRHAAALRLKWPNDLLLQERKLGGILIEAAPAAGAGQEGWMVIGFGANLDAAPPVAGRQTACLSELGETPGADAVVDRLLKTLLLRLQFQAHPGLLRRDWLDRAHPVGTRLVVREAGGQVEGSFASIEEDGTLVLDTGGGLRRFTTGEVLLSRGA